MIDDASKENKNEYSTEEQSGAGHFTSDEEGIFQNRNNGFKQTVSPSNQYAGFPIAHRTVHTRHHMEPRVNYRGKKEKTRITF